MRIEYGMLPELHTAARRQRAQAIAHFVGLAFAWLFSHKPVARHAARPHFAR